ncbi:protein TIFY 7-like [Bidens hawaiensis]|uniref:protein TIFY 7-like n=1 Tax=Bidens hawaiensis TaxID=980011 RepID=UPI00404907DF
MVNVYEDMSLEKAQAIMLLAGNGAKAQAQAATPRTPAVDAVHVGQPMKTTVPSPVSIGPSMARDGPSVMSSLRRVMQSDVPQMREASLARFLEKRRERVMASAPYNGKPGSRSAPSKDDHKK